MDATARAASQNGTPSKTPPLLNASPRQNWVSHQCRVNRNLTLPKKGNLNHFEPPSIVQVGCNKVKVTLPALAATFSTLKPTNSNEVPCNQANCSQTWRAKQQLLGGVRASSASNQPNLSNGLTWCGMRCEDSNLGNFAVSCVSVSQSGKLSAQDRNQTLQHVLLVSPTASGSTHRIEKLALAPAQLT